MSKEGFAGICLQLAGRIRESWGEWTGDSVLADVGRRDRIIGRTQQDSAMAREQAARQLKDFQNHNRNWYF